MANTKSKTTTTANTKTKAQLEMENAQLTNTVSDMQSQLDEMKKLIENLANTQNTVVANTTTNNVEVQQSEIEDYDEIVIRPDRYIPVMSLASTRLILKAGKGKFYNFGEYGEVQNIIYSDIMEIVRNHRKLAMEGAFYILNEKVVSAQGLKANYDEILNKQALDELVNKSVDEFEPIFTKLSSSQKKAVINNVVKAVVDNQDVSMNIINVINKDCKVNIDTMVDDYMHYEETVKEIESEK